MIDHVYRIVLLLNLTEFFRFLAPHAGGDVGSVSLILLSINVAYLAVRFREVGRLLRKRAVVGWLILLAGWPVVSALYAPEPDMRRIALQLYYAALFLGSAAFVYRRRWSAIQELAGLALLISFAGLALAWLMPQYFEPVAEISGAKSDYHGRSAGFFMQPNQAGGCLVFLFIAWYAGGRTKGPILTGALTLAMLVAIAFTGSRGSMVAALVTGSIMLWARLAHEGSSRQLRVSRGVRVVQVAGVAILLSVAIVAAIQALEESDSTADAYVMLGRRLELFMDMSPEEVQDDRSVAIRLVAQTQYLEKIAEQPLFGYGLGAAEEYQLDGELVKSSHNIFIETAFHYGVLYPLAFLMLLVGMLRHSNRNLSEKRLGTNSITQLVIALVLLGMLSNTLLSLRPIIAIVGAFAACLHYPERIDRRVRRFVLGGSVVPQALRRA